MKKATKKKSTAKGFGALGIVLIIVLIIVVLGAGSYLTYNYYFPGKVTEQVKSSLTNLADKAKPTTGTKTAAAQKFAAYQAVATDIQPQLADYSVKADLSNVTNGQDYTEILAAGADSRKKLVDNKFVVLPGYHDEFFSLYEENRYGYTPSFVTADSIVHTYHLFFNYLLEDLEVNFMIPNLLTLNQRMMVQAEAAYNQLKGTGWEAAAKRNWAFFALASKLLADSTVVPAEVAELVNQELALIAAGGIELSPIVNYQTDLSPATQLKEDYSQYKPRGHYTKSDALKKYFQTMMWYGRITFRALGQEETKSAILITWTLKQNSDIQEIWGKIYEPINFFVGKADDLTYDDYVKLLSANYGEQPAAKTLTQDKTKLASFIAGIKDLPAPQINSMPIWDTFNGNPDREEVIKGYRFMGQRFTIDASVFQRLIYREVGDKEHTCEDGVLKWAQCDGGSRCLPKGLDITAAMGSNEALNILTDLGETQYACYPENLSRMKTYLRDLDTPTWTQNLYWGWIYMLRPMLSAKETGWPSFMQNQAWARKDINTYLASWTELKHDTILYAKQVYAELGGGPPAGDDRGYVEPEVETYARLAGLITMTKEGLQIRNILSEQQATNLDRLENLVLQLKVISEKELKGQELASEEYELIKAYGGSLEHFWLETISAKDKEGKTNDELLLSNPAPLVADVATDPNGQVLEEATGKIDIIYVVVPVGGSLRIAKGGVYSYYEFPQSLSAGRLTDEEWREKLNSGQAPDRPSWTMSFLTAK